MNPHTARSISPIEILRSLRRNHQLIFDLVRRDVLGRYRGSVLGIAWSFFNPILMLSVYTFVFSVVFKARWVGGGDSKVEFALVLFTGLMLFNLFSECINRAPSLIVSNVNYVKKIIFPLEVLPFVALGSAAFHLLINVVVWFLFYMFFFGFPPLSALFLPVILVPFVLMIIGLSWLLASLGVYLRDVAQIVGVFTSVLLFLSPIFYPLSVLPVEYQTVMNFSPITFVVEEARNIAIWGGGVDWRNWAVQLLISSITFWLGFSWFQKTRMGFADVL